MSTPQVLYHYCSTAAFHAIAETRSIRLSSLTLANDTMEGKVVASAVTRLAKSDSLDAQATERLLKFISAFEEIFDGLGFCLSEEGDLLSQWRGYAADGSGVAIGFSASYLQWLAQATKSADIPGFTLQQVRYDPKDQEVEVEPTYRQVRKLIDEGAFRSTVFSLLDSRTEEEREKEKKTIEEKFWRLSFTLLALFSKLYLLKSPAFREEKEWRLVSYLNRAADHTCSYRAVNDRVLPYRSFTFLEPERQPIAEIVLGPKHLTPVNVIEHFLKVSGFGNVAVKRSEATYR